MSIFKFFVVIIALLLSTYLYMSNNQKSYLLEGNVFGTYYIIKANAPHNQPKINKAVNQKFNKINSQMSVFDNKSEITQINNLGVNKWFDLSPELSFLLKQAYHVYTISNGHFDPSIGKLIDLWGFGTDKSAVFPNKKDILKAKSIANFDNFKFSHDFSKIKKIKKDAKLNLSAIAKGYAVDQIALVLESFKIYNFIVEIGGEVRVGGVKNKKLNGWNVAVAMPNDLKKENAIIMTIKDISLATSGDYRNFFIKDGKRYSHTISPQTGFPVEGNLTSVTILDSSCMMADAYATAIMAMGEVKGLEFANNHNISAILFLRNNNDKIKIIFSDKANKLNGV